MLQDIQQPPTYTEKFSVSSNKEQFLQEILHDIPEYTPPRVAPHFNVPVVNKANNRKVQYAALAVAAVVIFFMVKKILEMYSVANF